MSADGRGARRCDAEVGSVRTGRRSCMRRAVVHVAVPVPIVTDRTTVKLLGPDLPERKGRLVFPAPEDLIAGD